MKLAIGGLLGLAYAFMTYLAYSRSAAGWNAGHADLGVWWAVIGSFLAIAGLAAVVGTWLHARQSRT